MSATIVSRRPGRPAAQHPAARTQILEALVGLLESSPLVLPSLRTVAQAAGVTPALLHYHFGDLAGLMRCLLEERALPQLQPALRELQSRQPDAAGALARFLRTWTTLALRHRWLCACLLQPIAHDAGSLQALGAQLQATVSEAQREGAVRQDLPAGYIALLLLSLGAVPHLAGTSLAAGLALGNMADAGSAATLTLQHLTVMQKGVGRAAGAVAALGSGH